jgi:hypothetical protein
MTYCKPCKKLYLENRAEWLKSEDKFGYEVIQKVGQLSYRCKCNRCDFIWLTRSTDAAFQFNEPEKHQANQALFRQFSKKLIEERRRGYTVLKYPKSIVPMEYGDDDT